MKQFFKKLFGYKYETFVFYGSLYGETYVTCAITKPINSKSIPNAREINSFQSSVISWDNEPQEYYEGQKIPIYTKELPNKLMNRHTLIK